ncbi:MAG TPA: SNF2-related protein, partial [Polyangiaceae bacterium]
RRKPRSKAKRVFDIEPQLFRGSELRAPLGVRYVHRDGSAIIGTELVRCARSDAAWLGAIAAQGSLGHVAEADLPEFVERVFGRHGVSALSLPADYDCSEESPAPRPVLDLEAPSGKKLHARVAFDYAGRRIPAEQESRLVLAERKAWERRRNAERQALDALAQVGFAGELLGNARQPRAGSVTIEERALAPALRELLSAGWLVQAEGKRYRAASGFNIQVESGIDWFEVKGGVTFEGGELPFPKLLAAIKQRRSVVQLGDGTFGVLPEEWMQRWGLLAELAGPLAETLRVSSRQIGLLQALLAALPEQDAGARGLRTLRRKLDEFHAVKPARAARGFRGALRPYQEQGLGWLSTLGELGFGACLADDMGLGKTIQVLAYLHSQRQKRSGRRKAALVVVPRSLLSNWLDEAARFAPQLAVRQHWGAERQRTKESLSGADIVLTTYGTLRSDIALFGDVDFACVVLDEAQAIKNKQSSTAKCAKLLRADRRIAMSGTPVENHLGELWSLFEFLNPGLLKELPVLRRALESPKPSDEVLGLVRTLVRPFVLRRTKREVAKDLPDRVEQTLYVELEQDERQLYDELLLHYQASIAKKVVDVGVERATPHLLEALLRLRQAACHPGLIDRGRQRESSAKVECLVERLRALRAEGHRALVFSQFTSLLSIVRERLTEEQISFEYLDGKTRDRAGVVERFQSDPSINAFLISLKAGGVGLNLTAADYVFILDPWWNPAAEAQAIDRAHRIGQTRNVIAYRLLAKRTVEERVAHLQAQKRDLVAGIMGDDQALAARLTRDDLEALLSLTAAAAPNASTPTG